MPQRKIRLESRFWRKVIRSPGCWLWAGALRNGVGAIAVEGEVAQAHRVAWQLAYGPPPPTRHLRHLCGNKACVRPDHLELSDRAQRQLGVERHGLSLLQGGARPERQPAHPSPEARVRSRRAALTGR